MENGHFMGLQLSAHPESSKRGGLSAAVQQVHRKHKGGPVSHMHQSLASLQQSKDSIMHQSIAADGRLFSLPLCVA